MLFQPQFYRIFSYACKGLVLTAPNSVANTFLGFLVKVIITVKKNFAVEYDILMMMTEIIFWYIKFSEEHSASVFKAEETNKQRSLLPADCLFALLYDSCKFFPPNRLWPDKLRCRI
jgi:hypothetical protein